MRASPEHSFIDLLSGEYLSKWRATRPPARFSADVPLVFVHVPKTAGTSFSNLLGQWFKRPYGVKWDDIDESFAGFLEKYDDHDLVSGHINAKHVLRCLEDPRPFHVAAFIRHPVDRAVSNYAYCYSEKHPTHEEFRARFPTIDDWVDWGHGCSNYLAKYLVGGASSVQEFIDRAAIGYDFIGASEVFNMSAFVFSVAFGKHFDPPVKPLNTAIERAPTVPSHSDAISDRLSELNAVDIGFYEYVLGLYQSRADEILTVALRN